MNVFLFIRYGFAEGFAGEMMVTRFGVLRRVAARHQEIVRLRDRGRSSDHGLPSRHSVVYLVRSNDSVFVAARGVAPIDRPANV